MTVEQRLDQLEKRNKRLTVGLTMSEACLRSTAYRGKRSAAAGRFTMQKRRQMRHNNVFTRVILAPELYRRQEIVVLDCTVSRRLIYP